MNEQETTAEIIAELRQWARNAIVNGEGYKLEDTCGALGGFIQVIADRLGAAHTRESVAAAKLRAALEPWIAFAEWLLENAGKDALGVAIRDNGPIIRQRLEELRAALSATEKEGGIM